MHYGNEIFVVIVCAGAFFFLNVTTCIFPLRACVQMGEQVKKRKYVGLDSRLDQAGICEEVPIRDRPFRGKLDPSTF